MDAAEAPGPRDAPPAAALTAWLDRPPPRIALAELPTPVERAPWLAAIAQRPADVWVKRDDRSSARYGGGKVRKLEWILASPPFDRAPVVRSLGGIGSHHLLALALFLAPRGAQLHAITFDTRPTPHVVTNLAALVSLGTRLWSVRSRLTLPWAYAAYALWDRPSEAAVTMAAGASTPLGGLGHVQAALELAAQIRGGQLPAPRTIYVTAGTAGTCAGLAIGLALAGVPAHLRLVSSVERPFFNGWMMRAMLRRIAAVLHAAGVRDLGPAAAALRTHGAMAALARAGVTWSIDGRAVGGGYGVPTAAAEQARALAGAAGLALDGTYTAKCLASLIADLRAGDPRTDGPVLLWNTHGANDMRAHVQPGWRARLPASLRARLDRAAPADPADPLGLPAHASAQERG